MINPQGAAIQMEGCITMGLGYALAEEVDFRIRFYSMMTLVMESISVLGILFDKKCYFNITRYIGTE